RRVDPPRGARERLSHAGSASPAGDLFGLFRSRFPRDLDSPVVELDDGSAYTYRELERFSACYGRSLIALGARKGDRLVVQVEKSPENLFLYLAALRIGVVYVPLNPAYTSAEFETLVTDAEPLVVVCRPEDEERVRALGACEVLTLGADRRGTLIERSEAHPKALPT